MAPPQQQKADHGKETVPKARRPEPVNLGPEALPEVPDRLALQRALDEPSMATPESVVALQNTAGNRAVQRLLATRQLDVPNASTMPVQRHCWPMTADQTASFVEGSQEERTGAANQVYYRMQADDQTTGSSFFAPITDNVPANRVMQIAEDGIVSQDERKLLAVKRDWVPTWKYLVLYLVTSKKHQYWGIAREQRDESGDVYQGGAYQAVFPADRNAELIKAVPVVEA